MAGGSGYRQVVSRLVMLSAGGACSWRSLLSQGPRLARITRLMGMLSWGESGILKKSSRLLVEPDALGDRTLRAALSSWNPGSLVGVLVLS
jgi:hypothetical protein